VEEVGGKLAKVTSTETTGASRGFFSREEDDAAVAAK
jgi:hypothetical protein